MNRFGRKIAKGVNSMLSKKHSLFWLQLLSLFSIIGVGFASWTIFGGDFDSKGNTLITNNVINTSDYIYLDESKANGGIECFTYYNTGFVDGTYNDDTYQSDGYIVETEHIKVYFVLDVDKCDQMFETYDSLVISYKLAYSNDVSADAHNIFSDFVNNKGSITCAVNMKDTYQITSQSITATDYSFQIVLSDILNNYDSLSVLDKIEFSIDYAITIDKQSFMSNELYKTFMDEDFSFTLSLDLTAK